MRKLLLLPLLLLIFAGCSKEDDDTPANRNNTSLLTDHTWQIDELIQQVGPVQTRYVRGGINETGSNYQNSRLTFNEDGSGEFRDPLNNTYDLTWEFTSVDESKMEVVVDYPVPVTLPYLFVSITENTMHYTTYYNENGTSALSTSKWIPATP